MRDKGRRCDCGKIAGAAYVCRDCVADAREHLATIGALAAYADDKRAKRGAIDYRRGGGGRPRETPLPFDPRVSRVITPIIVGLQGAHDIVCEGRGWHLAIPRPAGISDVCRWLTDHVEWLATRAEGAEELAFIETSASNLARLFDRPPERLYLGRCEAVVAADDGAETTCEEHVYVERTKALAPQVECRRCRAMVDVHERRAEFQQAVRVYQATMRELAHLAPMFLDAGVSRRTLHEWTRHGLLRAVGERVEFDKDGRRRTVPTYRIGDLAEARIAWEQSKDERRSRRRSERIGA